MSKGIGVFPDASGQHRHVARAFPSAPARQWALAQIDFHLYYHYQKHQIVRHACMRACFGTVRPDEDSRHRIQENVDNRRLSLVSLTVERR